MNLVTVFSMLAMLLGLGGAIPQIARMAATRTAAGQSPTGWAMGLCCNLAMSYVNWAGFHAPLLTCSAALGAVLCATALTLVIVLGRRDQPAGQTAAPRACPDALGQMQTMEFQVLHAAVVEADRRRRLQAGELVAA